MLLPTGPGTYAAKTTKRAPLLDTVSGLTPSVPTRNVLFIFPRKLKAGATPLPKRMRPLDYHRVHDVAPRLSNRQNAAPYIMGTLVPFRPGSHSQEYRGPCRLPPRICISVRGLSGRAPLLRPLTGPSHAV